MAEVKTGIGDWLEKAETFIAAASIAVVVIAVFFDVLLRELFSNPVLWLQELSMWAFKWFIFTGSAVAIRRGSHYRIELLDKMIRNSGRKKMLAIFVLLVNFLFAGFLAVYGLEFAELGLKRVSNPSGIPLLYMFIAMPIAGFSMCYFIVEKFVERVKTRGN